MTPITARSCEAAKIHRILGERSGNGFSRAAEPRRSTPTIASHDHGPLWFRLCEMRTRSDSAAAIQSASRVRPFLKATNPALPSSRDRPAWRRVAQHVSTVPRRCSQARSWPNSTERSLSRAFAVRPRDGRARTRSGLRRLTFGAKRTTRDQLFGERR